MPMLREERYTYADLLNWKGQERYELIDGALHMLASPTYSHQMIIGEIFRQISNYLRGKTCKAVLSPLIQPRMRIRGGQNNHLEELT